MRDSCRCDDCQLVNMLRLLSILTRRRRDPARALAAQQQCTMRDSCRCDDCQDILSQIGYSNTITNVEHPLKENMTLLYAVYKIIIKLERCLNQRVEAIADRRLEARYRGREEAARRVSSSV
ncbi:hypothetical protein JYU34_000930 [Plutella xylostella]|uniref:Uncharacterized protein n=1 Tax=Plutella xylostella TaxID=51655 RepID=A0ABQ7R5U4_PLUXY|nr:hypothetical protein JYU34_000930 [Plutella xylostella]